VQERATEEIRAEVADIFKAQWQKRDSQVVPDTPDLKLGNDAVELKGAVLYADLADSTNLVNAGVRSLQDGDFTLVVQERSKRSYNFWTRCLEIE
jgi:hypothetical protein